ncbi:hypothetical protein C8R43DRAFT_898805 [Mycena crocata]|nr:hypothetical protein C8R43DRAFT_898805 [Mycena crocata]
MNPTKWVNATNEYNARLKALPGGAGKDLVSKNPRALLEKLGEIETTIATRLSTNNFRSEKNSTVFWTKHCHAVPFIKTEVSEANVGTTAENHKLRYCSDGFRPTLEDDTPAVWPLPSGIFTKGATFHPLIFLSNVRELHQRLVIEQAKQEDLSMEQDAFRQLLESRVIVDSDTGAVMFKMFNAETFKVPDSDRIPAELYVDYNGAHYLYINSLRDTAPVTVE